MPKIIFLIFYFGPFPNYFPFFLDSCGRNPQITWRIYTDNEPPRDLPDHVQFISMTFAQCQERFRQKFSFPICLDTPKKLCDFKPAYGYILEEELRGYDFWGHCDVDGIFGDVQGFLSRMDMGQYDKLFTLGHFTLYRNDPAVNRIFMNPVDGVLRYREAYQRPELIGFDEWGPGNINDICERAGLRFLKEAAGADVWPGRTNFSLSGYNRERNRYYPMDRRDGVFQIRAGRLYRCWREGGQIRRQEYPWVHLQKRSFTLPLDLHSRAEYDIIPGSFETEGRDPEELLDLAGRRHIPDRQYWRVKIRNIRTRLRTGNFRWH